MINLQHYVEHIAIINVQMYVFDMANIYSYEECTLFKDNTTKELQRSNQLARGT